MGWGANDRRRYRKGTEVFAEQVAMQLDSLLSAGFTRREALELIKQTVVQQHNHEHYTHFVEAEQIPKPETQPIVE